MAEAYPSPAYRCLLCQEEYKRPRELPCGHTFCCPCLTTYIQDEHVSADEDRLYFPCPICDTPIVPRDPSVHVNTWATSFPINHLFLAPKKPTSNDNVCEACLRDGESCTAEVWCTDCAEMLCKQCNTWHRRSKVLTRHRLVPISGEEGKEIQDITINEICPQHDGNRFEFYCMDHRAMCCSVCVSLSHRHCNTIKPLDDVIQKTATRQHETEWEEIREETKKISEDDNSQIINLNSEENEASVEMTQVIQLAKDKLDDLNNTFQSDLVRKCNTYRQQITSRLRCVSTFNTNAENSHLLMSRLEIQGSDRQAFITREKTKNQMSGNHRRMDQNTKKQSNTFDITLKIATIVDEIMKVTTIGDVDVTSSISLTSQNANACIGTLLGTILSTPSPCTFADSTSTSDHTDSLPVDVWTGSLSCVQTVLSSTLGGYYTPALVGGTFTDSGQLLITDNNNRRLLLFDDKYSYLSEYKFDRDPTDVTRGRDADDIFVAMHDGQILKCTLQNDVLTVIDKITGPFNAQGIAVHGDNIMRGTLDSVHYLSMDGSVTRSITKNRGDTYLAVSTSTASLYHTDGHDVVCRRLDSVEEVYRYRDARLKYPIGIGLDRDDNVYVCGSSSKNVYLVSSDGTRWKVLITNTADINSPYGLVVHPTKQEFVVISLNDSTSFKVYRFSNNAC